MTQTREAQIAARVQELKNLAHATSAAFTPADAKVLERRQVAVLTEFLAELQQLSAKPNVPTKFPPDGLSKNSGAITARVVSLPKRG